MGIVGLMLLISLLLSVGFLGGFLWANRQGQFDDLESPAVRAVWDE